jgi:hypothetical protein
VPENEIAETSPTITNAEKLWVAASALLAIISCVILMSMRVLSAISFNEPLFVVTSGAEEESLLSVWRAMQGLEIYLSPSKPPFITSYYNGIFYHSFGYITGLALVIFDLEDAWLPTIGRLFALGGATVGAILCFNVLGYLADPRETPHSRSSWVLRLAISIFIFYGPLVGFWAISINPEIWATVFTIFAFWAMLKWYDAFPLRAIAVASAFSLLAWGFKQSYIFFPLAAGLFLLYRRNWHGLILLCIIHWAAWACILYFSSDAYRSMLFQLDTENTFAWQQLIRNTSNLALKITPIVAALLIWTVRAPMGRPPFDDWKGHLIIPRTTNMQLVFFGTIAAALTIPFSAKVGASENYYFLLTFFLGLYTYVISVRVLSGAPNRIDAIILSAGWVANAIAVTAVIIGVTGISSVRHWNDHHQKQRACIANLPAPYLGFTNLYTNLPWMHPEPPHIVLAWNYHYDRAAGRSFEGNGIAGQIRRKYFASLVVPTTSEPIKIDGQAPVGYQVVRRNCAGLDILIRKE